MELIIGKQNEKVILTKENDIVEEYDFAKPIDFSKLFKELIQQEFSDFIKLVIEDFEKTDEESELIRLIKNLIDDYNAKKKELDDFIKQQS